MSANGNQDQTSNLSRPEIQHMQARVLECPDAHDDDTSDVYKGLSITDQTTMADVTVSMLWYHNRDAFAAFLDMTNVSNFSFTLAEESDAEPEPEVRINMTVQRHENYVMVGFYHKLPMPDTHIPNSIIHWLQQIVYRVADSGAWSLYSGSWNRRAEASKDLIQDTLENSDFYLERAPLNSVEGTVIVDGMPMSRQDVFADEKLLIQHMACCCGYPYPNIISRWAKDVGNGDGQLRRDGSILP